MDTCLYKKIYSSSSLLFSTTSIFPNVEYEIYKNENIENVYKIKLKTPSEVLLKSLKQTKIITGIIINDFFTEITFQAYNVLPLEEYIKKTNWTYEKTLDIISSLTKQIETLKKNSYSFYGFNKEAIIVINESIFFQISSDYLFPLTKEYIQIHIPFSKNMFISPEMLYLYKLPVKVHFKTIYYSLSALCIYLLYKKNLFEKKNVKPEINDINELLITIEGTKLYWFLLRGLTEDVEKRSLLYI